MYQILKVVCGSASLMWNKISFEIKYLFQYLSHYPWHNHVWKRWIYSDMNMATIMGEILSKDELNNYLITNEILFNKNPETDLQTTFIIYKHRDNSNTWRTKYCSFIYEGYRWITIVTNYQYTAFFAPLMGEELINVTQNRGLHRWLMFSLI